MDDVEGCEVENVGNKEGVDLRRRWFGEINELGERIIDDELKRWLIDDDDKADVKLSSSLSS